MAASYGDAITKFRSDPVMFVKTLLKEEPQKHQAEVMDAVAQGERRVSIRSGRRIGKTTLLSWLSLWFEMTRMDARTIVTAPSSGQLEDAYVPNFRHWAQRLPKELFPMWDIKAGRFDFKMHERQGFENFVTIRTARKDSPESLQGINAEHVLVLVDEAAGVDDINFEALSGSLGGEKAHMVLTGNPNHASGYFYDTHTTLSDTWRNIHVNSENCDLVSKDWIEEMRMRWGQKSNAYRIHVLGEFPTADEDTIIPLELIESAVERDVEETGMTAWGLDPARFGKDSTALCVRKGNTVKSVVVWHGLDTMEVSGRVKAEWDETPPDERPIDILVDSIGIGAGIVDRLRELGLPVRGVNVSESPSLKGKHLNLKAELWWKLREWFEARNVNIPKDNKLIRELAGVRAGYTSTGSLKIKDKDDGMHHDSADALMLTLASVAISLAGRRRHRGPLKRNIKGVV